MADWGLLQGLGDGLANVGMTLLKSELEDKLSKAREAREEEMEARREQRRADRERVTPDPNQTDYVQKNGVWYEQIRSKQGNVLEERLAPENKVREFREKDEENKRKAEAEAVSLRRSTALADIAERDLADYESDKEFDRQYKRMSLEARARTGAYSDDNVEHTEEEEVALLARENKGTFDSIASKYKDFVDATDYNRIVRRAVQDARARGISPNAYLQEILRHYEKRLKDKASSGESNAPEQGARDLGKR